MKKLNIQGITIILVGLIVVLGTLAVLFPAISDALMIGLAVIIGGAFLAMIGSVIKEQLDKRKKK